ncbi:MAG: NAD(P)/FAD-dependent oxidoreductase [Actinomycetota bacterium]|nr:NAD(P)/FAD-dependent oxidoreductase [Actinomycetota bacterium]
MADSYDAVVIGAGHNGLVCACYLARAGLRVVVLERSDRIGGACVTEELFEGFRISTASYSLSLLMPDIVRELGLDLEIRPKDPSAFAPLDGGGGLFLWNDRARAAESIARVSERDGRAYIEFEELFEEAARRLRPLLSYPATRKQVRRAFRKSEVEDLFAKTVDGSIASVCEGYFETEVMQGVMASQGIIGSAAGPRTPGTAYIFLHHAFGTVAGSSGAWGFARGGMGTVTAELARVLREAGGEIRLESEVARVLLEEKRRVAGVVLDSGEEIQSSVVCSNADPKRTMGFVPRDVLPPEFAEDVELLPTDGTVVKVNCALSGLPRFTGIESSNGPGPEHTGTITVAPSIDYLEKACRSAAEGRPAEEMFCEAWIQTASEPDLAPDGKHTLSIFAQYVPYKFAEGTWDERRDEIGDLAIGTLERYAPGLSDLIEDRLVLGPPDLEERFGLSGGNIFHGEILPDWLFERRPATGWHRHRWPLAGLYLCGSGAHPGGGVCGAPGKNAARAVLADAVAARD